jgi:hypothetical protein
MTLRSGTRRGPRAARMIYRHLGPLGWHRLARVSLPAHGRIGQPRIVLVRLAGICGQLAARHQTPKLWALFHGQVGHSTTLPAEVPVRVPMIRMVFHGPRIVP